MKPFINIALTNLPLYNAGHLFFKWLTLPVSDEQLSAALKEIAIDEKNEEYFISDYDSNIKHSFGEHTPITKLNEVAARLEDLDLIDFDTIFDNRPSDMSLFEYEQFLIQNTFDRLGALADNLDMLDLISDYTTLSFIAEVGSYPRDDSGRPDLIGIRNMTATLSNAAEVVQYDGNDNLKDVTLKDLQNLQEEIVEEYLKTL